MYIEESFETIFNMDYGSVKSPMVERVKSESAFWVLPLIIKYTIIYGFCGVLGGFVDEGVLSP